MMPGNDKEACLDAETLQQRLLEAEAHAAAVGLEMSYLKQQLAEANSSLKTN